MTFKTKPIYFVTENFSFTDDRMEIWNIRVGSRIYTMSEKSGRRALVESFCARHVRPVWLWEDPDPSPFAFGNPECTWHTMKLVDEEGPVTRHTLTFPADNTLLYTDCRLFLAVVALATGACSRPEIDMPGSDWDTAQIGGQEILHAAYAATWFVYVVSEVALLSDEKTLEIRRVDAIESLWLCALPDEGVCAMFPDGVRFFDSLVQAVQAYRTDVAGVPKDRRVACLWYREGEQSYHRISSINWDGRVGTFLIPDNFSFLH